MGIVVGLASDALNASRFLHNFDLTFHDLSTVKAYSFWYSCAASSKMYETIIFIGIGFGLFVLLLFLRLDGSFGLVLSLKSYHVLSFLSFMRITMMRVIYSLHNYFFI
jgi:hypothetical protein